MTDKPIEAYRSYLAVLARAGLHPMLQAKLDASDVVQQTLLEAHRDDERFRGATSGQRAAWLRQILARNLLNALRDWRRARRDVARDRPLDVATGSSAAALRSWLATDETSPSLRVEREELLLVVAAAVGELPEAQQRAIVLRNWVGLSLDEIAALMERSPSAVAGLLRRGMAALRQQLGSDHV